MGKRVFLAIVAFSLVITTCDDLFNMDIVETSTSVRKVSFSGPTETVTLNLGSASKGIYLVKVNVSGNDIRATDTGGSSGSIISIASNNALSEPGEALIPRMGHPAADEYHANPPPFERKPQERSAFAASVAYSVGSSKSFWVETVLDNHIFVQKPATLRAQGTYGNIWVMNDLTNFTATQAQEMAAKFDVIYPAETSLLGYEYGGGPSGDGGWDNDKRIQILVYDIGYDPSATTLGYFWAKDMRKDTGSGQRSNEAEMFYLNGNPNVFSKFGENALYSTLIHEFQHMINFNQKYVKRGKSSETWYDEMLSMMAEDIISPLIGINASNLNHPIKSRIPRFLTNYNLAGITEWGSVNDNILDSYAITYAFGAYLLRNYGGASLLQELLANNSTNIDSVTAALKTVNNKNWMSFYEALRRFGEVLVYSGNMPDDVQSFDKTVTNTIGGYTYTATKFNVWSDFGSEKPRIFNWNYVAIKGYSLTVYQSPTWKDQTGNVTITLQRPGDPNVEFYLMWK